MAKGLIVKLETKYEDGGYTILATHYGIELVATYVMGEMRVSGTSQRRPDWRLAAAAKAIKAYALARVTSFGPDFEAAHRALYELDQAA